MKKFDNFCSALHNLQKIYEYEEPYDAVVLTGLVALFEICFERAWKAMKEILETHGFSVNGSARMILKTAFSTDMITDKQNWLKCLASRNLASPAYNQLIALDIVKNTKETYCVLFSQLKTEIEDKWL